MAERDEALALAQQHQLATNGGDGAALQNGVQDPESHTTLPILSDEERRALAKSVFDEERKALEESLAAAEAKSVELERKALEVEANISNTLKERSDKMKDALNKRLKDRRRRPNKSSGKPGSSSRTSLGSGSSKRGRSGWPSTRPRVQARRPPRPLPRLPSRQTAGFRRRRLHPCPASTCQS